MHGITESRHSWDPLLPGLAGSFDVLAVDLRGHGESEVVPPFDVFTMATDLHDVVEAEGIDRPLLIGHSLGGMVVSVYASMFEARGVINVDQSLELSAFKAALGPGVDEDSAVDATFVKGDCVAGFADEVALRAAQP